MPRKAAVPQVPGATETAETTAPVAQDVGQDAAPEADTVTVSKATLDALMARVQALESKQRAVRQATIEAQPLPDESDIDLATLKTPVLTKQGWIVPETYGSNPAAPKAF